MFERFTPSAREVVIGARTQADQLGHRHVGTEHLLLGLLSPAAGAPATILTVAGLTEASVRADIVRLLSVGLLSVGPFGDSDAAALEAIGIDLNAVRAKLEESFGPGALEPEVPPTRYGMFGRKLSGGRFTPRAKKVLELSLREALRLGHRFGGADQRGISIGTEHVLLGILREGQGLAAQILAEAGVPFEPLRRDLEHSLRAAA
jgi:ATP-dependent Clp protease ATP-binding subunit ClpA